MTKNHLSLLYSHGAACLIAVCFFLLAMIYSLITPLFESPDEVWHYPFIWHLARTWELPIQDPNHPQLWHQEGSQPPLYYALAALLTAPVTTDDLESLLYRNPHADIGVVKADRNANIIVHTEREQWPWQEIVLAVRLTRFFSILLGTGTVITCYALGRLLWPKQPLFPLLAMGFIAFNPMFLFISSSVNNDNLITFLASLTLWQLISMIIQSQAKPPLLPLIGLGLLTGLAALTKISGLGLWGLVGLSLLIWGLYHRSWRIALFGNLIIGLVTLLIAGWWYWRNIQLYDHWSGTNIMIAMMGPRSIPPTTTQFLAELRTLFRSFWGLFGYFSVPMPTWCYWLFNIFLGTGLLGLLKGKQLSPRLRSVWPILAGWLIILIGGLIQWTLQTPATQGRLLFPGLTALAILWAAGWTLLIPIRWQWIPIVIFFAIATWVPWDVIRPAYARPTPTNMETLQPLTAKFGEIIHLLGYQLQTTAIQPGDPLPLTLCWQTEEVIETDYTVFIHLIDEYGLIVAQRDMFHGGGTYPTTQWKRDQPFCDDYVLEIPSTAYAPTQARFAVGLYDHTTSQRLQTTDQKDRFIFGDVALRSKPDADYPNPQRLEFEEGITLIGYELDRREASPGETIRVTLYWESQQRPDQTYKIFVHLVGANEIRGGQHDSEPQPPTSAWQSGQIIVDHHPLTIGLETPPGAYNIIVGLYEGESGQRLRLLKNRDAFVQADSVTLGGIFIK